MQVIGEESAYLEASEGVGEWRCKGRRWLHLPLNPERLRKLTEDYVSSNAKIKAALGVGKMPVDARDGLKVTLERFME